MRRTLRVALMLSATSAALTACSDQPISAPLVPRVTRVNAAVGNLPVTQCDFTALRAAVRDYVAAGNDSIYDYIRDMGTDAYGQGMNGLARLATVRASTSLKKSSATAAQGAAAVIQFLACMPIGDSVQTDFATNIVAAMDTGGMFEVPTTGSTDAVYSRGEATGAQFWVATPEDAGDSWGSLAGQRYLVFGYKITNPNGFDFNVVPVLGQDGMPKPLNDSLIVGSCGTFGGNVRVQHEADILPDVDMTAVCLGKNSPPIASLSSGFGSNFAALVRKGLNVFAPEPLYAVVFDGGGIGGAVSELSPTVPTTVVPTLAFAQQPFTNKAVGDELGIKVSVSSGGSPLKNALVTLTVTGNSGLNAIFIDYTLNPPTGKICAQVTRTTDASGTADFSKVGVIKSGGYIFSAAATWDGLPATSIQSILTNIKNKKITLPATC